VERPFNAVVAIDSAVIGFENSGFNIAAGLRTYLLMKATLEFSYGQS
jgi:hypothetical protein